ncbi:MAG: NUDIX hydrolase [Lachnospiraceae bacterium]|nr:NUDIX hydrolase [Lachnospiraceae bacterium]
MSFKGIKKVFEGRFIDRYDVTYETADGQTKVYEMISREHDLDSHERLSNHSTDAVVLIMHDESKEKILLNREYRMAAGEFVFNFPAGLIDPGENAIEAGKRELREETGLQIIKIEEVLIDSYSAVGFSNEKNQCVIGIAGGEFKPSTSALEVIEAKWYTKEEIRNLLKTSAFAARTQAYCYMWSKL